MQSSKTLQPQTNSTLSPESKPSDDDVPRCFESGARGLLYKLRQACLSISGNLDPDTVLKEVVESACSLADAKYGVLLTHDKSGALKDVVSFGIAPEHLVGMDTPPEGKGLLGYMNELRGPLRVADIATHPKSVGFPLNHPPMKNFLGVPIYHGSDRVGNIYLTEKATGPEFTSVDEEAVVMFAAQAATAIVNAARYEKERRARVDLEALVNISPVGLVVFDAQTGNITSLNPEVRRIVGGVHGHSNAWEETYKALSFRRADGRKISFAEQPLTRALQSGETVRAEEIVIDLPDGRSITTLVNAAPIYSEQGDILSVVVAMQDMTPLQDVERMRGEFLGLVSQELRMPLSTIKGSIAALTETIDPSNQTEALQLLRIIDQQADLMRGQINSLIELSHIQAGTLPVLPEPTSVQSLVDGACTEFRRGHIGSRIEVNLPTDLPTVMADRQRVVQVLQNLFAHASQHSAEDATIKVSAIHEAREVAVSVAAADNHGSDLAQSQPFQFLWKIHTENIKHASNGDGLAFAICKGIVEAHGGRIWARDTECGGEVSFTFTIPACEDNGAGYPDPLEPPEEAQVHAGQKQKILVAIEDDRALGAVRRVLSRSGFEPIPTDDLNNLEDLMESERPQLLLMDLTTPDASEFQLLRRLYTRYELPIIVLSDCSDDESIVKAFDVGADGYVVKPVSSTELVARIKASLRRQAIPAKPPGQANYKAGQVAIDYDSHVVTVDGHQTQLTATEYKLLVELSSNAGRVLTQDELLRRVWGPEYFGEAQLLRAYVKTLRQKLGDNARKPSYIFTEHGIGYRMVKQ
jgi:two-component system KDP operon response regulator KdpE